jgi:hypothetical protein
VRDQPRGPQINDRHCINCPLSSARLSSKPLPLLTLSVYHSMPPRKSTQSKPAPKRAKTKVNFGANGGSRKRKANGTAPPDGTPDAGPSSTKRARKEAGPSSSSPDNADADADADPDANTGGAGSTSADKSGSAANNTPTGTTKTKKRVRNRWGISPTEVPANAKMTEVCLTFVLFRRCKTS